MSRALILGCSHAAGAEMEDDPDLPLDLRYIAFGRQHSYPVLIALGLGYAADNWAISGGSNDAMFRIFNEQLDQLTTADLVIACWTGPDRSEIWHETEKIWLQLNCGRVEFNTVNFESDNPTGWDSGCRVADHDMYLSYLRQWVAVSSIKSNEYNKIKNMLALNAIAQKHAIRVINLCSFGPVDQIDCAVPESFCGWAEAQAYPIGPSGHYYLPAHRAYADIVLAALR